MTETARVVRTKDRLELACTSDVCEACSSLFCSPKVRTFEAENPGGIDLKPGDTVEVEIPSAPAVAAAFRVFVVPLLLFVAGYFVSGLLGAADELIQVVFGLIGLAAGFGALALRKRRGLAGDRPIVRGKVEAPQPELTSPVISP